MLLEAGLLRDPIRYLSRAIIARKNDYYRLLRSVTSDGAWIDWILFMLEAVRESATSTTRKIGSIRTCQEDIAERARAATAVDPGDRRSREWLPGTPTASMEWRERDTEAFEEASCRRSSRQPSRAKVSVG